jgi:hypothetical protein
MIVVRVCRSGANRVSTGPRNMGGDVDWIQLAEDRVVLTFRDWQTFR